MKINIRQVNEATNFEAQNENDDTIQIKGISGDDMEARGFSPMEMLLTSVAACSAIDLVLILKKQRQPLQDLQIEVNGERTENTTPRPFKSIDINFILTGDLEESKVARAVELAVEKYCSVADTMDQGVNISHRFEIRQH